MSKPTLCRLSYPTVDDGQPATFTLGSHDDAVKFNKKMREAGAFVSDWCEYEITDPDTADISRIVSEMNTPAT